MSLVEGDFDCLVLGKVLGNQHVLFPSHEELEVVCPDQTSSTEELDGSSSGFPGDDTSEMIIIKKCATDLIVSEYVFVSLDLQNSSTLAAVQGASGSADISTPFTPTVNFSAFTS